MNITDIILLILIIISVLALLFVPGLNKKYRSPYWNLVYLIPALFAVADGVLCGSCLRYAGIYLCCFICLICFFINKANIKSVLILVSIVLFSVNFIFVLNGTAVRSVNYHSQFVEGFSILKKYYCLGDYKNINWDELYKKYEPEFARVTLENDAEENYHLWNKFTSEFYDPHTYYISSDYNDDYADNVFGNDYGLSIMTLSDGRNVAVNVDPSIAGNIPNGTEIISWNGQSVDSQKNLNEYDVRDYSDITNREFYSALYVAGYGNDTASVTYINNEGKQETLVLPKLGPYYSNRLAKTLNIIDQGVNIGHMTFKEYGNDTVLYRLKEMSYDTESMNKGDYSSMKNELRDMLLEYKAAGKKNLIFDLRGNCGGSPLMIASIISLIAPEGQHIMAYGGVINKEDATFLKNENGYELGPSLSYEGEDLWNHGNIYILANADCASAGDWFIHEMNKFDNVTSMGFTKSTGVGQGINGIQLGENALSFSQIITMDENGEVMIDSGKDHISRIDVDMTIPFDSNAVDSLFNNEEDYVLNYCLEMIN